ncbi:hypothetical protein [Mycolicibacterium gadium]|uniref:Secreted protein n=1 Tax=Mycolicibacterium gadium TaxID=1794 RepID=A0ABT6GXF4_MYCGU|nr:hypothetical protein [Mycolicibacterium gadium]MDG5486161.1 hypothetical protein [Mycolicibacterium gadium]
MNDIALAIVTLLAQDPPRQTGPDFGKASPFGLLVLVLLLIGTFGLVWSMNRHLRKLPKSFDEPDEQAGGGSDGPVDDGESKRESG